MRTPLFAVVFVCAFALFPSPPEADAADVLLRHTDSREDPDEEPQVPTLRLPDSAPHQSFDPVDEPPPSRPNRFQELATKFNKDVYAVGGFKSEVQRSRPKNTVSKPVTKQPNREDKQHTHDAQDGQDGQDSQHVQDQTEKNPLRRVSSLDFNSDWLVRRGGIEYFEGVTRPFLQLTQKSLDPVSKMLYKLLRDEDRVFELLEKEFEYEHGASPAGGPDHAKLFAHSRCYYSTSMVARAILGFKPDETIYDQQWVEATSIDFAKDQRFETGFWVYLIELQDMKAGDMDNLGHVFLMTQYNGGAAVVWQSNYYRMTVSDFMHKLPRGRLSVDTFIHDLYRDLVRPERSYVKRLAYKKYFGEESEYAKAMGGMPQDLQMLLAQQWDNDPTFSIFIQYKKVRLNEALTHIQRAARSIGVKLPHFIDHEDMWDHQRAGQGGMFDQLQIPQSEKFGAFKKPEARGHKNVGDNQIPAGAVDVHLGGAIGHDENGDGEAHHVRGAGQDRAGADV